MNQINQVKILQIYHKEYKTQKHKYNITTQTIQQRKNLKKKEEQLIQWKEAIHVLMKNVKKYMVQKSHQIYISDQNIMEDLKLKEKKQLNKSLLPNLRMKNHRFIKSIYLLTFQMNFVKHILNSQRIQNKHIIKNYNYELYKQQLMFTEIIDYSPLIDVYPLAKFALNFILQKSSELATENKILKLVDQYSDQQTFNLINMVMTQKYMTPQSHPQFREEKEPPKGEKETFASQIQCKYMENNEINEESVNNINNLNQNSSFYKMKKTIAVSQKLKSSQNKPYFNIYQVEPVTFTQDNQDDHYRSLYEKKQAVIEQMKKNREKLIKEQEIQQQQREQITKRYQKTTITYDFDGTIIQLKQPSNQETSNLKVVNAKVQTKKTNRTGLSSIRQTIQRQTIENPQLTAISKSVNQKPDDSKNMIGQILCLNSYNYERYQKFNKIQKFKTLMHDSSLRLTKQQYKEAVEINQDFKEHLLKQQFAPKRSTKVVTQKIESPTQIKKQTSEKLKTQQQEIDESKITQSNWKQGRIQIVQYNQLKDLLIKEDLINCSLPLDNAVNTTLNTESQYKMISFTNNDGQLPQLKKCSKAHNQISRQITNKSRSKTYYQ